MKKDLFRTGKKVTLARSHSQNSKGLSILFFSNYIFDCIKKNNQLCYIPSKFNKTILIK